MQEFLQNLFTAVITAAVPVLTAFTISFIQKYKAQAIAETDDTKAQRYIAEIGDAIADAVAATSQTYVDSLKNAGGFTIAAQSEAAKRALTAAVASISPAAQSFIEAAYGDLTEYLTTKIEAEVRNQKISTGLPVAALMDSTADTTAVAATTAAATAASIAQTAIQQLSAETTLAEQVE